MQPFFPRLRAKLPVYVRDVRQRPAWGLMFLFGRMVAARRLYIAWLRRSRPVPALPRPDHDALADQTAEEVADAVRRDGYAVGLSLPHEAVGEIRAFAERTTCYAWMDRAMPFRVGEHGAAEARYGRSILVGHFLDGVDQCAAARAVFDNGWLRAVAADYLGVPPVLIASRLWWSFPSPEASAGDLSTASQGRYHYDLDDWRQIKFFFYLTDTTPDNGPHIYVRGSHLTHPRRVQISPFVGVSRAMIDRRYGADSIVTIHGKAGSGFAEDPFGLHMGAILRDGVRLILEVSYGTDRLMPHRLYGELGPRTGPKENGA